jgi:histidine triad (HIT) family protein
MVECVLCAIAAGTEPSRVVIENNRAKAFLDINPAGLGHTLVIPRSHASSIWEPNDEDAGEVWRRVEHEPSGAYKNVM